MTAPAYSLEAWRKLRERRERSELPTSPPPATSLADIPADAEMDEGIVIGFWNGERFVSWEKWIATAPIAVESAPTSPPLPEASAYSATCGSTWLWLRKDGDRWLIFAGSQKSRRRDFASPFLEHAMRTAEAWYGSAADGWRPETRTTQAGKEDRDADPAK